MSFEVGSIYRFDTLAPTVLGVSYSNMKVDGLVSANIASKHMDIHSRHKQLKGLITDLHADANNCTFIMFTNVSNNETVILALEYIVTSSIVSTEAVTLTVTIPNSSPTHGPIIREALRKVGITVGSITF